MSETRILCEGYHDRAFWAGWLTHLGCSDAGFRPSTKGHPAADPWGSTVKGSGQFGYHSKSKGFIRVVQCRGKSNVLPEARNRLLQRASKALPRLVVNVDSDALPAAVATGMRAQDVLRFIQTQIDPAAAPNADGEIEVDGGTTKVSLIRWEAPDAAARGLPDQQTLERLVCAAIAAVYAPRAKAVQDWLDSRPAPPAVSPKDHSWSYMAGWRSEDGCEFFSNLWRDAAVAGALESRLRPSGAWSVAELLAQ